MEGLMQDGYRLVVTNILDYAARFHSEQQIITRTVEGPLATCTYADLHRRAQFCALALERLGVKPGDRVATMAWNTARHLEAWYGIMGAGAVCHTLNPRLFAKELEYIVNHAEDSVILLDLTFAQLLAGLAPKLPTVRHFVVMTDRAHMPAGARALGALCYEDLLQQEVARLPFRWVRVDENAACGLCYTSGTTGNPKGVLYSHRANFLHAIAVCLADGQDLGAGDTVLPVVPMFHANAWGLAFSAPLVGARLVMPGPQLDGASVYSMLEDNRVNKTAGVPTVWLALLDYVDSKGLRFTHLKQVGIGGSAAPRAMIERFKKLGVEVRHLWGMTETTPVGTHGALKGPLRTLPPEQQLDIQAKQGRPHIFLDMRIVDDQGRELPWDGRAFGNLQVRGPHVIKAYFRHKGSSGVDKDGWFDTGDVATIDKWGHMQITDRSKDVIKSGGEWISTIEIENVAVAHPKVREAAVIGVAHPKWVERPLLVVVPADPKAPPTKDELVKYLEGKVAKWWLPDDVVVVPELPHTATGKIYKLQLRKQLKDYRLPQPKL